MHKELCEAALSSNVSSALLKKVSRSRIGKEMIGIFTTNNLNEHLVPSTYSDLSRTQGWNPLYAFLLIHALQLQGKIFQFPSTPKLYRNPVDFRINESTTESLSSEEIENKFSREALRNLARFQRFIFYGIIGNPLHDFGIPELKDYLNELNKFEKTGIILASYFHSLNKIAHAIGKPVGGIAKSIPLVKYIVMESLKFSTQEADLINSFIENSYVVHALINTHKSFNFSRKDVGMNFCEEN